MYKLIKMFIVIGCITLLLACEKNVQETLFNADSRVFFAPHGSADSLFHSFANHPAADEKELLLPLKIMGNIENRDRFVQVAVDPSGTTAMTSEYEIGPAIVVPAGSVTGVLPLKIKNTARLEADEVQLVIKLRPSTDFVVEPEKSGKLNELVGFRVIWSNILAQPTDWPTTLWGGYSRTKHRLVIDLTGRSEYSGAEWVSNGFAYSIMGVCNEWLAAYSLSHSGAPYTDENGKTIRFCPTCN